MRHRLGATRLLRDAVTLNFRPGPPGARLADQTSDKVSALPGRRQPGCFRRGLGRFPAPGRLRLDRLSPAIGALPTGVAAKFRVAPAWNEGPVAHGAERLALPPATGPPLPLRAAVGTDHQPGARSHCWPQPRQTTVASSVASSVSQVVSQAVSGAIRHPQRYGSPVGRKTFIAYPQRRSKGLGEVHFGFSRSRARDLAPLPRKAKSQIIWALKVSRLSNPVRTAFNPPDPVSQTRPIAAFRFFRTAHPRNSRPLKRKDPRARGSDAFGFLRSPPGPIWDRPGSWPPLAPIPQFCCARRKHWRGGPGRQPIRPGQCP